MPRMTQKRARELLHKKLGKPKNELDKHIFDQLVKLAGKKVVIQYGVHLGENPGRLAALLARKKLEGDKRVGFLEFNAPMELYRESAIWQALPKLVKEAPSDRRIYAVEQELVEKDRIHSRRYNRDMIQQAITEILKPKHYIDVHATDSKGLGAPLCDNHFVLGLIYEDHFKVLESMYKRTRNLVDSWHKESIKSTPSFADIAVEVVANSITPKKPRRVRKFYEETYKMYSTVNPLDERGKRNARATAKFLERYVKRLLELKQRGVRERPTLFEWREDGSFIKKHSKKERKKLKR